VDVRKLVWATRLLADAVFEQVEQKIDEAEEVLHQGLKSSDLGLRLQAARFLLRQSEFGRRRGWARGARRGNPAEAQPVTIMDRLGRRRAPIPAATELLLENLCGQGGKL
jgi:hypothetical protein